MKRRHPRCCGSEQECCGLTFIEVYDPETDSYSLEQVPHCVAQEMFGDAMVVERPEEPPTE